MTITTTGNQIDYTGDGASVAFAFPYPFITSADLKVYLNGVLLSTGYSVAGVAPAGGSGTFSSGTVTFVSAPALSASVLIYCDPDQLQSTSLPPNDPFPSKTVEKMIDKVTLLVQRLKTAFGNAITFPPGESVSGLLPAAADRLGKILRFDDITGAIELATSIGATVLSRSIIGQYFLPRTTAEIAAGVTPTVYFWPPGDVRRYGGILTSNDVANETANNAAIVACIAANGTAFIDEGDFNTSAAIRLALDGKRLRGAGQYKTNIRYSGTDAAIHFGGTFPTLVYNNEVRDLSVFISSRAATTFGIRGTSCVYWNLENVSCFGSGNPNSGVPADQVLYGSGLYLTDNAIIGRVSHVSCRLWDKGYYLRTDPSSQSRWVAAVEFSGQGELANNMRGIVVGDPTVNKYCGVGCTFHDLSVQGNYTTGINCNSGDSTVFNTVYFEGNANYDIVFGDPSGCPLPIGCKIINSPMNSESIGTTVYGTFPYLQKVYVNRGVNTTIRDNNMSISTAIALIKLEAASDTANVAGNRLNSTAAATARITDLSTTTITRDNAPEAPRTYVGTFTRALNAAGATVTVTGLGFRPTEVEIMGSVATLAGVRCDGYASFESGAQQQCRSFDAAGNANVSATALKLIGPTGADYTSATLTAVAVGSFDLLFAKNGTPPADVATYIYRAKRS